MKILILEDKHDNNYIYNYLTENNIYFDYIVCFNEDTVISGEFVKILEDVKFEDYDLIIIDYAFISYMGIGNNFTILRNVEYRLKKFIKRCKNVLVISAVSLITEDFIEFLEEQGCIILEKHVNSIEECLQLIGYNSSNL